MSKVGIIMGSISDYEVMQNASKTLKKLGIQFEEKVISAHRTPEAAHEYAITAEDYGIDVIIAGAGGAAHLAGVIASMTVLPVIGVPLEANSLGGMDALLSTVQMPKGIPVATVAIGKAGAINAAILAAQILSLKEPELRQKLQILRAEETLQILNIKLPPTIL
jgi:5-(carboxyamino)imidazole ribonucleotide mutase